MISSETSKHLATFFHFKPTFSNRQPERPLSQEGRLAVGPEVSWWRLPRSGEAAKRLRRCCVRACVCVRVARAHTVRYFYYFYLNSVLHSVSWSVSWSVSLIGREPFIYRLGGVSLSVSLPVSLPVSRSAAMAPTQKGRRCSGRRQAARRAPFSGSPRIGL